MDRIKSDIENLASVFERKGYDHTYLFGGENIGKIREGIMEYIDNLSPEQRKAKLEKGISLSGYLLWNGEDQPRIQAHMMLTHANNGFKIKSLDLTYSDEYNNLLSNLTISNSPIVNLPNKADVVKTLKRKWEQKSIRTHKIKRGL